MPTRLYLPYDIGARRMAHAILRPTVIKFLEMAFADDATDIQIEEILVKPKSRLAGVDLISSGILQEMNLIIIAIRTKQGHMLFNPKADTKFEPGDTVVVMGGAKGLGRLEKMLHS
ncbi:MAG: TrkA C-terminal domain-containing protein [Desulfobacula sp.]|nr:TrkA C-terminal domain-containing protein [Desulfobacula sp.]